MRVLWNIFIQNIDPIDFRQIQIVVLDVGRYHTVIVLQVSHEVVEFHWRRARLLVAQACRPLYRTVQLNQDICVISVNQGFGGFRSNVVVMTLEVYVFCFAFL
jgi:hypothetical protein